MSRDRVKQSPRTADEPMAFTPLDLAKGALWAWLAFMILLELGLMVFAIIAQASAPSGAFLATGYAIILMLGYSALYAGGIGMVVTVVVTPVAWMLGRMLRRHKAIRLHLLAYTALGGMIAGLAAGYLTAIGWNVAIAVQHPVVAICFAATVISVPIGWWISARGALRDHRAGGRGEQLSSRGDVDALFGATRS